MKIPHKHAEIIKAWADGVEIEVQDAHAKSGWSVTSDPEWSHMREYRVKPEPEVSPKAIILIDELVRLTEDSVDSFGTTVAEQATAYNALKAYILELEQRAGL